MSRAASLSIDNILRFLQLKPEGATLSDIQRGLKLRKSEQRALVKIVANLKKRKAIVELTDGRLVLSKRRQDREKTLGQPEQRQGSQATPSATPCTAITSRLNSEGLVQDRQVSAPKGASRAFWTGRTRRSLVFFV